MSELDIGLVIPSWIVTLLKAKIRSPAALRDAILRAEKMTAEAAVEKGVIDAAYASGEETVRAAVEMGEELVGRKWKGNVYAENRKILFSDVLPGLGFVETVEDVNKAGVISRL